jgi:hypothetical protein
MVSSKGQVATSYIIIYYIKYINSPSEIYMMKYTCNIREQLDEVYVQHTEQLHRIINHKKKIQSAEYILYI